MEEEISRATAVESSSSTAASKRCAWASKLRWIPTSTDLIVAAEKRLLSLVKTSYVHEQVNIGPGPPGSKVRWFRSSSDQPRFINTITFDSKEDAPTLVMVHGYAASQGFFFRNFDALAAHFRVIAIDQLGVLLEEKGHTRYCYAGAEDNLISILVSLMSEYFLEIDLKGSSKLTVLEFTITINILVDSLNVGGS